MNHYIRELISRMCIRQLRLLSDMEYFDPGDSRRERIHQHAQWLGAEIEVAKAVLEKEPKPESYKTAEDGGILEVLKEHGIK